jgi:hypothetical protein
MDALEQIMAGLATGDDAMECALWCTFGDELRRFLLRTNGQLGLPRLRSDDLDGLMWDACGAIRAVAGGWRADGGARPWVYARHRLEQLLRDHAGPPTRQWADHDGCAVAEGPPPVAADDPPAVVVLDRLARRGEHPVLGLLQDALEAVVRRPDDRELVLLYAEQLAARDRSPAHTVATLLDRRAVNVRQTFCRIRRRLRTLALTDARYRPLLALPLLGAEGDGEGFGVVAA